MVITGLMTRAIGVLRTLRYIAQPRPWPIEPPVVVQFPVNDVCDSKCQMCNIWQQKLDKQISPEQARRVFSDPLFRKVVVVGMNGGEPTLRHDLPELADALFDGMPRLRSVSLITNGLHSGRAIARIDALAKRVTARGGRLDVMVSLDGVGTVHDRVRGAPGNFEEAVRVLDYVLSLGDDVDVRVGCTVIRDNVHGLHELLDFCMARGVYVKFRLGVPHRRLYNLAPPPPRTIGKSTWLDTHPFALDDSERWHIAQFLVGLTREYEPSLQQRFFYRSLAAQVLYRSPRRAGCDWQHRGVTVTSRGELMYCAVQSDVLGDACDTSAERLYYGGREVLRRILAEKCAGCAHDYVGPPGGWQQALLFAEALSNRFGMSREILRNTPLYSALTRIARWREERAFAQERRRLAGASLPPAPAPVGAPAPVLICGWYGTETLGDKAILAAIVTAIRRESPQAPIWIASLEPQLTRLTIAELPELQGCTVMDVERALSEIHCVSALVFGGGPLMAVSPVAAMEALFARARERAIPALVAGCGVGPLGSPEYRRSIAALLSAASARIFRDEESRQAAGRLGIADPDDRVTEDPAMGWALAMADGARMERERPRVLALGLREWPYYQYAPHLTARRAERIRADFEQALVRALDRLAHEVAGLKIVPIPFCTHDVGGDDRLLYWRLARATPRLRAAVDTSTIGKDLGPLEYVQRLKDADACLAMRFHSIVFSMALSKPLVAIDYTMGNGKSAAIARRHGLEAMSLEGLHADELLQRLHAALRPGAPGPVPTAPQFASVFQAIWRKHVSRVSGP